MIVNKCALIHLIWFSVVFAAGPHRLPPDFYLIAHRGGVVDDTLAENSIKGLEEAIRRGYTHIEVDLRMTLDGYVVCSHDGSLLREAGIDKKISELTLAELRQYKLCKSGETIPTFDEICRRCAGRINIMVDPKGTSEEMLESYVMQIDALLSKHNLLSQALFISNRIPLHDQDKVLDWFLGRARTCWRYSPERSEILCRAFKNCGDDHFIFNSPADFSQQKIERFHKLGLKVIASVNLSHYTQGDPLRQGEEDIRKMLLWGVDGLQIDSCYDAVVFSYFESH